MKQQYREETVSGLVAECLALLEDGVQEIPFAKICAKHPELQGEVERAVERAGGFSDMQAAGPGRDVMLGALIAERYRIVDRIGSGAMGVVYLATDLDLGRSVAIKVVHTGFLKAATAVARFEREAAALAAVKHESVVTIFDRGMTVDGAPFLVMEYIEGVLCSSILEHAADRPRTDDAGWLSEELDLDPSSETSFLRQTIRWAADLAGGLEAAHHAGVFHRDVKPSNVMIRRDGRAVLLDFGIAAKEDHLTLTSTDAAVGTPAYMAPEALMGRTKALPTQDVYGLAATLYHCMTLQAPYIGTPSEVLTSLALREPVPAFKVRPGLPLDAQAILDHGLMRSPSARYRSAAAMESDLRKLLAYEPVSVRPTSTIVRVLRRVRRSKAAAGALAASVLIAGALGFNASRVSAQERSVNAHADAWEHLPANHCIVNAANRRYALEEAEAWIFNTLDQLVEIDHERLPSLALRAATHVDYGDLPSAVEDMRSVDRIVGSDFSAALLAQYELLAEGQSIDLGALPEPTTSNDLYLAGFHLMRAGRYKDAIPLLGDERVPDLRHVHELNLVLGILHVEAKRKDEDRFERDRRAFALLAQAEELETEGGFASATTCHIRCFALSRMEEYARSLDVGREGLELCPYSLVTLQNGANAALEESQDGPGQLEEGLGLVRRAVRLLPDYSKIVVLHARILAEQGLIDEARSVLTSHTFAKSGRDQRLKLLANAIVEAQAAYLQFETDPAAADQAAEAALAYLAELPEGHEGRLVFEPIAKALHHREEHALFEALLIGLTERPLRLRSLGEIAGQMPDDLSPEHTSLLKSWLSKRADLVQRKSLLSAGRTPAESDR